VSVAEVDGLRVVIAATGDDIVEDISFSIESGEVLGIVGESGSGKTTIGTALLGYARPGSRIDAGTIRIDGVDLLALDSLALRKARGNLVSYIPQDPGAALNPALRIFEQVEEVLAAHRVGASDQERRARIEQVLGEVKLPTAREFLRRFPHQLSGGQQQRVCIALAFVALPKVVVLDEPTTGLDVTTQAHVLATVRDLCAKHGVAALYVTHDLAVLSGLAQRVMVVYAGRAAELGPTAQVFGAGAHPYSRKLVAAIPDPSARREFGTIPGTAPSPGARPEQGCRFAPRCEWAVERCAAIVPPSVGFGTDHRSWCFRAAEVQASSAALGAAAAPARTVGHAPVLEVEDLHAAYGDEEVLKGISLSLQRGECLAIVGESGSGKTTMARSIVGLMPNWSGSIRVDGQALATRARSRPAEVRRSLGYVFQNPFASLNPRKTVGDAVAMPLREFTDKGRAEIRVAVGEALERVSLPTAIALRYPAHLSGGERQRVAIARALVTEPKVLICDEITSALDVSVQATIMRLLERLRSEEQQLSLLFVTHNLGLVRSVADRVHVMHLGEIVERGETNQLFEAPQRAYTRGLLADTPSVLATPTSKSDLPARAQLAP